MTRMKWSLLPLAIFFCIGCAAGTKRTYDVVVHNRSEVPVMVWLTKDGPPVENGWYSPDQFLETSPDTPSPGVQLPAGKTADTGNVSGTFPKGTNAILLVFRSGVEADRHGSSHQLTLKLKPGKNEFAVSIDPTGRLFVYDPVISTTTPIAIEP
jgi:hypothetical protein